MSFAQDITPQMIASVIDHTFLKTEAEGVSQDDQKKNVLKLVEDGTKYGAYSVCVRSNMVALAKKKILELGSPLKIASVIGFPDGDKFSTSEKIAELEQARRDGADEFDMVIKVKALKAGHEQEVYDDVLAVSKASGVQPLKVIFENAYLNNEQKIKAYSLVINALKEAAGGDLGKLRGRFLKTSTGFAKPAAGIAVGATVEDVKLMHAACQDLLLGIKPAGGVNNLAEAIEFFKAAGSPMTAKGAIDPMGYRIGSSSLLKSLFGQSDSKGSPY